MIRIANTSVLNPKARIIMFSRYVILIVLTAAATYLPRVLPLVVSFAGRLPQNVKRFLTIIPIATLGALLFPGLLLDFSFFPLSGIIGICVAALASWRFGGIILPVLLSIGAVFVMLIAFPLM